ncbi:MAG: hypothetical protein JNM93_04950 [Bacteriovoracaceae bacterium]|nr:hypothetical protein [Bacteriovoracaceae bacterium]
MSRDKLKLVTSPNDRFEQIKNEKNYVGQPAYDLIGATVEQLQIKPDESMRPAAFRADPSNPMHFWAHPLTIEAMKKDIFLLGENPENHAQNYECVQCHEQLDRQFWVKCPYCGTRFKL